jgi:hypothetical protein
MFKDAGPGIGAIIPIYIIMRQLGLVDAYQAC